MIVKNNKFISFALTISGFVLVLLCAGLASAQEATSKMSGLELSNDKPIQIESDKLEIRQQENKAVFSGNVLVVQGTTTLRAGHMVVYYTGGGGSISSGSADIKTIDVSEKVYLESGEQQATADTGRFDMAAQTFVLKGEKVVLSEGANVFTGCQLTVFMETGEAQLESCGGRVQIQLDPKSQKAK